MTCMLWRDWSRSLPSEDRNGTIASVCTVTSFPTEWPSLLKNIQDLFEHKAKFFSTNHHCHNWPLQQWRVDRLNDSKHRSPAHTNLGRQGLGNRCAGPVQHWQLLADQHFNHYYVKPAMCHSIKSPWVASQRTIVSLCCKRKEDC